MIFSAPEMKKVSAGASRAEREQLFEEYRGALRKANPHLFYADGRRKSTFRLLIDIFVRS